jgi:hypothetical protein
MAGKHGVCCGRSVIRARSRKLLGYNISLRLLLKWFVYFRQFLK